MQGAPGSHGIETSPRPPRLEEADAIEELVNGSLAADVGLSIYQPGALRRAWEEGEAFAQHRVIASAEGITGVAWVEVDEDEPSLYFEVYLASGSGDLAPILIEVAEEQAQELARTARTKVKVEATVGRPDLVALLEAHGYRRGKTHIPMLVDLEQAAEPEWPAGVRPRTYREGVDDALMFSTMRAGFGEDWQDPEDPDVWLKKHRASAYDPHLWFFAEDASGKVLGAVHSRTSWEGSTDTGWIRNLAVLPDARRRGVGRALLLESFARIRSLGLKKVILGVDEVNETGALDLYTGVGMREGGRSTDLVKILNGG